MYLTLWGWVTHLYMSDLTIIGSDNEWLVPWSTPNNYLNQCWNITNWKLRNKLQWNLNRNSNIFIQEYAFGSVVWEMAAMLSWPKCVNKTHFIPNLLHRVHMILMEIMVHWFHIYSLTALWIKGYSKFIFKTGVAKLLFVSCWCFYLMHCIIITQNTSVSCERCLLMHRQSKVSCDY